MTLSDVFFPSFSRLNEEIQIYISSYLDFSTLSSLSSTAHGYSHFVQEALKMNYEYLQTMPNSFILKRLCGKLNSELPAEKKMKILLKRVKVFFKEDYLFLRRSPISLKEYNLPGLDSLVATILEEKTRHLLALFQQIARQSPIAQAFQSTLKDLSWEVKFQIQDWMKENLPLLNEISVVILEELPEIPEEIFLLKGLTLELQKRIIEKIVGKNFLSYLRFFLANYQEGDQVRLETFFLTSIKLGKISFVEIILKSSHASHISSNTFKDVFQLILSSRSLHNPQRKAQDFITRLLLLRPRVRLSIGLPRDIFFRAATLGYDQTIRTLIELNHLPSVSVEGLNHAWLGACYYGFYLVLESLLLCNRFLEISSQTLGEGFSAAARRGYFLVVRQLLAIDRKEELSPFYLGKAICSASNYGHTQVVQELIQSEFVLERISAKDFSCAIELAIRKRNPRIENLLRRSSKMQELSCRHRFWIKVETVIGTCKGFFCNSCC